MRNLMQLVGGVVVAGAVAAGSTAFTAAGVTNTISGSTLVGGTVNQSVHGAKLIKLALGTAAAPNADRVTSISLELETDSGGTALGATDVVTVAVTGTPSGGSDPAGAVAGCVQGSGKVWTCAVTGWYTAVTGIAVTVAPPV